MLVRLERDWTDPTGAAHSAGDVVEVDAVTLSELEATGVVERPGEGRSNGSSVQTESVGVSGWAGPSDAGGLSDTDATSGAGYAQEDTVVVRPRDPDRSGQG